LVNLFVWPLKTDVLGVFYFFFSFEPEEINRSQQEHLIGNKNSAYLIYLGVSSALRIYKIPKPMANSIAVVPISCAPVNSIITVNRALIARPNQISLLLYTTPIIANGLIQRMLKLFLVARCSVPNIIKIKNIPVTLRAPNNKCSNLSRIGDEALGQIRKNEKIKNRMATKRGEVKKLLFLDLK
jgi:hypothetical protein